MKKIRKILHVIPGLIFFAITFISCFDEKDFELDKLTITDLEPTLYLPLLNDTIRLDASNDYNVLYDANGVGYLRFAIDDDIFPPLKDFFAVSDSDIDISFEHPHAADGAGYSTTESYPCLYAVSRSGQQLDSIIFRSGTFSIVINTPTNTPTPVAGSYTVNIPALTKNNVAFSEIVPFNTPTFNLNLSGYMLRFRDNNMFDATVGVEILPSSPHGLYQLNRISFSDVEMEEVYGYFGKHQAISPPVKVMDVSTFDKFRNNNTTTLRLKEAFLDFRVDNGAGFPIQLRIDTIISTSGGQSVKKGKVDSVIIPANKLSQQYFRSELSIGGEAFGEVLNNMPSEVEFQFSATINPDGSKGGTVKNFLTASSSIAVSNIGARIPLDFSVTGMMLKDTLNFSASRVDFKNMELLMNVENNIPVGVVLQAYLIDGNNNVNPAPLFKIPVDIPAATVDAATGEVTAPHLYVEKIDTNTEGLSQAKKLKVDITVNSGNYPQYVRVTKNNYIYIRIGAKAKVNIDNLD